MFFSNFIFDLPPFVIEVFNCKTAFLNSAVFIFAIKLGGLLFLKKIKRHLPAYV
jgi:hypothetical protein